LWAVVVSGDGLMADGGGCGQLWLFVVVMAAAVVVAAATVVVVVC
jgi:hypothetical protein